MADPVTQIAPITAYNYPSILLKQMWDGELSPRSIHPANMTFAERDTFGDELKKKIGGNPVADAMIDVGTNPFVWLMFLTSGYFKLPVPGKIFSLGEKYNAFVRETGKGGIFHALKLLTGGQLLRGTYGEGLLQQIGKSVKGEADRAMLSLQPAYQKMLVKSGVRSMTEGDGAYLNKLIYAKMHGLDETRTVVKPIIKKGAGGTSVSYARNTVDPLFEKSLLDSELQRFGADEYVVALRKYMDDTRDVLFRKEGSATFEIDPDKVVKLYRGISGNSAMFKPSGASQGGIGFVQNVLGREILGEVAAGSLKLDDFQQLVATAFKEGLPQHYFPRNTHSFFHSGVKISRGQLAEIQKTAALKGSGVAVGRSRTHELFDPEDLQALGGLVSNRTHAAYQGALARSASAIGKTAANKSVGRLLSMDAQDATTRYVHSSSAVKALFVDSLGPEVLQAQRESMQVLKKALASDPERSAAFYAQGKISTARGNEHFFDEVMDKTGLDAPVGGFSPADALEALHFSINDTTTKRWLGETIIPAVLGKVEPREGVMRALVAHGQAGLKAFLGTGVGDALRKTGQMGVSFANRLDEIANADFSERGISAGLAKYLYGSHLGLNMGTIALNMSQPLITSMRLFGPVQGTRLYAQALADTLEEFSKYSHEVRNRPGGFMGKLLPDNAVKMDNIKKSFILASDKYENAIHIGPDVLTTLDGISYTGRQLANQHGFFNRVNDLSLKLFEKSEIINRNVTGHMIRRFHMENGMPVGHAGMLQEIRQVVNETQFGGDALNTPLIFLDPKSAFNNPLMRQFMTFPLRMMTGAFHSFPLAGGENYTKGLARDFIRGMGWSAIMYEGMKNVTGANLDRSLYFNSVTDIFLRPADRYLPPALSIPKGVAQSLMEGDGDILRRELPRLLPSGIAVSKALGIAPSIQQVPGVKMLQRTFVDWNQTDAEGNVAVFKYDGGLVGYENPITMMMKGAGLELMGSGRQPEVEGFLLKQREQISDYRRRYLVKLSSNRVDEAQAIASEFQSRFGFKLQISKTQLKAYLDARTVARPERILNRLPEELRQQLTPMVSGTLAGRLGLPQEQFNAYETSRKRDAARRANPQYPKGVEEEVKRILSEEAKKQRQAELLQGFGSY